MSTVLLLKHGFLSRLKAGFRDSWSLLRSPDSLYLGLKKKWQAPIFLLLLLLLVPTVLIPSSHFILEKAYPSIEKEQVFGLFKTTHADERLEVRKIQANYLIWALSGVGAILSLIIYAPIIRFSADTEKVRLLEKWQQTVGGTGSFNLEERYRIDSEIGSGAMGVVFSTFDKILERNVALKELRSAYVKDPERRERFRREALTLAKLTHPGIVHIYDLFDDGERMILVMELVKGGTLEDLIANRAPFTIQEASRLIIQICEALSHVQQNGVVHRDLKPSNILIDEQQHLKVTDFGIAHLALESSLTLEGSLMGTPHYMSPEQATGKTTDFRSDIYSLGVIFYELLTGSPPFTGELTTVLLQQIHDQPPPLQCKRERLGDEAETLVMAMLKKDPDERLADYQDILRQLQTMQG